MENISINSKKEILRLPINTEYISVFSGYINLNICTKTLLINHIKDTFLQYFKIEIKNEDIEISEESDKYYYLVNKYEIHLPDLIYLEKKIIEYFEKYKDHEEEKLEEQLINDDENQTLIDSDKTSISSEDEIEVINNDKKNESLDGFFYLIHVREFIVSNQTIYKLGKTSCIKKRFKQYPKNSKLIYYKNVENKDETENHMKHIFKKKFNQRIDIGIEYYEGDINEMISVVNQYFDNELIDELNDYIPSKKKKKYLCKKNINPSEHADLFEYKKLINLKILKDFISKDIHENIKKYEELNNLESINDVKRIYIKYDYFSSDFYKPTTIEENLLFIKDLFSIEKFIFRKIVDCSKYDILKETTIFFYKWFDDDIQYKLLNHYFYYFKDDDRTFIDFVYKNQYDIEKEKFEIIKKIEEIIGWTMGDLEKIITPDDVRKTYHFLITNHQKIHCVFKLRDYSKKQKEENKNESIIQEFFEEDAYKTKYCLNMINKIFKDFNEYILTPQKKSKRTKTTIEYVFENRLPFLLT